MNRYETWDMRHETWDMRHETWDRYSIYIRHMSDIGRCTRYAYDMRPYKSDICLISDIVYMHTIWDHMYPIYTRYSIYAYDMIPYKSDIYVWYVSDIYPIWSDIYSLICIRYSIYAYDMGPYKSDICLISDIVYMHTIWDHINPIYVWYVSDIVYETICIRYSIWIR